MANDRDQSDPESQQNYVVGVHPAPGTILPKGSTVSILVHKDLPKKLERTPLTDEQVEARRQSWIRMSISPSFMELQGDSYYFSTSLQQLGAVDCNLHLKDRAIEAWSKEEQKLSENAQLRFLSESESWLWVMGAFQFLYVLDSQLAGATKKPPGLSGKVREEKKVFVRLRSPFAHLKALRDLDFIAPRHAYRKDGSVSWYVDSSTLYSRSGLSDRLHSLCRDIAAIPAGAVLK